MAQASGETLKTRVSKKGPILQKLSLAMGSEASPESRKSPSTEECVKQVSPTDTLYYTPHRKSTDTKSTSESSTTTTPTSIEVSPIGELRSYFFKILVIGNVNSGKTSLIRRFIYNCFTEDYSATVGVEYSLKIINYDKHTSVAMQLWDIGGEERVGQLTRPYYREASGAVVMYDVTNPNSFAAVSRWKQELDTKSALPDGSPVPCVLVGNKCDEERKIKLNVTVEEYCKQLGFLGWLETSAKEDININAPFDLLIEKMLGIEVIDQDDPEKLKLHKLEEKSRRMCNC